MGASTLVDLWKNCESKKDYSILTPKGPRVLLRSQFEKNSCKYNLEEYFIINAQMKVIDLEFLIL
jgi:hypothetical protein